ncbi:hypothetical protein CASFOL_038213 [Castilleja foliolosa]|uniref:Glutaredoxin domain-containing protein n=1 Tax=Castilleja foliolosa TaxID=1961234 RepID=A0ABD3BKT6_9LAMI
MGCVSSKHTAKEIKPQKLLKNGDNYIHHTVSLTSSTYGVLRLDKEKGNQTPPPESKPTTVEINRNSTSKEEPEIIDAWELMEGLEEEIGPFFAQARKSPKSRSKSPLKFLNQMGSPRKMKKIGGKENKCRANNIGSQENSPKGGILKESNNLKESVKRPSPRLWASIKGSPKGKSSRIDQSPVCSRRRSLGPLFDPELVASFEKEVSEEEEEIKKMAKYPGSILESYKKKCPPGGENTIILYTTTLRGIRKTFEDCNLARSIVESYNVQIIERDISMDSGFKEELRGLMGRKDVRVPLVFVKGRLIGGADEMVRLDEEGSLGILLRGIPKAGRAGCRGCAGIRFVMCYECNGSCKILGDDGKKSLKCGKCNENGLIHCPICC